MRTSHLYIFISCYIFEEAKSRALAATRQLAKRQITWLRSESGVRTFDALDSGVADVISGVLEVR